MKKLLLVLCLVTTSVFSAEVDTEKSIISWKGSKITGAFHEGKIFLKSSNLKVEKGEIISGEIIIDINSFTVGDLKGEWEQKFLKHMKSADFFDIKQFPTATLKILSIKKNQASAMLTIMGKTHTVSFPMLKFSKKYVGKLSFDRTKFGMKYGSSNFFKNLGDKVINDHVEVDVEIFIKK